MLLLFSYEPFLHQDLPTILAERLRPFREQLSLLLRRLYLNAENPVELSPTFFAHEVVCSGAHPLMGGGRMI